MTVINTLVRTYDISETEANIFLSGFTKLEMKKNEIFIPRDRVCHKIGLIEKGLLKCVYEKEGMDIVFEFAYENNFISDYYSFLTETPSQKEIICLEDTVLHVIHRDQLLDLARTYPFIGTMSRKTNELLFLKVHERLRSFLLESPAQRYQNLIRERQDLANRIPQYLIASYLNIQPETVSRIRKKLSPGNRS